MLNNSNVIGCDSDFVQGLAPLLSLVRLPFSWSSSSSLLPREHIWSIKAPKFTYVELTRNWHVHWCAMYNVCVHTLAQAYAYDCICMLMYDNICLNIIVYLLYIVYMCTPLCLCRSELWRSLRLPRQGIILGFVLLRLQEAFPEWVPWSFQWREGRHAKARRSVRFCKICKTHGEVIAFNTITLITLTLRTLVLRNGWNGWCRERQSCCDRHWFLNEKYRIHRTGFNTSTGRWCHGVRSPGCFLGESQLTLTSMRSINDKIWQAFFRNVANCGKSRHNGQSWLDFCSAPQRPFCDVWRQSKSNEENPSQPKVKAQAIWFQSYIAVWRWRYNKTMSESGPASRRSGKHRL